MIIAWMGYCLLMSALLGLAAVAVERALGNYRRPVRGVWAGAIAGSLLLPVVAYVAPALVARFSAIAASLPMTITSVPEFAVSGAPATDASGFDWSALVGPIGLGLGVAWAISVLAIGVHLAVTHRRLRREMLDWTPGEILDAPVLMSLDRGPAVVGVRRGVIVMPAWIAELEEDVVRLAFLHEQEHQGAGDHRLFAAGLLGVIAMPWNPIAWWQLRRLRLAIEFDCDRRVIARGVEPRRYAEALLIVGSRVSNPPLSAAAFAERRTAVERRLRRMTEPLGRLRGPRAALALGAGALAMVFACGSPLPTALGGGSGEVAATKVPSTDAVDVTLVPSFIPYDTSPSLQNRAEITRVLDELYPASLRAANVGGTVEMWLYLDESGAVANYQVKTTSGHEALDAATVEVVRRMRFSPARFEDHVTGVWISQWVTFEHLPMPASKQAPTPDADPAPDFVVTEIESGGPGLDVKMPDNVLIVIDGVIQGAGGHSMSDIGVLDIDHIEIIKGAVAEGLYGARAREGVIQITTKGGAGG